jgi:PAS domain S-box-containing protein
VRPRGGWPVYGLAAVFTIGGIAVNVFDHYRPIPSVALWVLATALVIRAVRTTLTSADMSRSLDAAQVAAALVESSDDAIFRTSRSGTVQSWNPGARVTFGHAPDDVLGRPLADLFAPDAAREVAALVDQAARGSRVGAGTIGLRADGRRIDLDLRLSPILDDQGGVAGLTAIAHDETERRHADRAERANKAKSEFLSRMSHELRTPLNAVLGFGQLLAMRDNAPDAKEEVEHILKAGQHLLELINETLEISHIESGRLALTIEPVDVGAVVEEVIGLMAPLSAAREIEVTVDRESLAVFAEADRQRLKQVLLNLVSNAVKFNRYGGRVDVAGARPSPGRLSISVADTGIGIDAADLPRLFSPFERLRAGEEDIEGSGLGLALSKGLMEAMEGSIAVASEPGAGATFALELPEATAGVRAAEPVRHEPLPRLVADAHAGDEVHRILYVEDTRSNIEMMEQIFATCDDLELTVAETGGTGIDAARELEPDVVLLDLNLPDIDGDEVMEHLRSDAVTHAIPVIVVSADATPAKIDALLARGALDYVTKPVDVARLMRAIDDALAAAAAGAAH